MPELSQGYDDLAAFYDTYSAHAAYPQWIRRLEALARDHGLAGDTVLDAACGTGASFLPLLELGYRVTAFDGSARMLDQARRKAGAEVELHCLDVTRLPVLGPFGLITWLNDGCNCLLESADLERAFLSLAANLADQGLLVFDANTLATYKGVFAARHVRVCDGLEFVWEGHAREVRAGSRASATLSVFRQPRDGREAISVSDHLQRHHPDRLIRDALRRAGLLVLACYGQEPDGVLTPKPIRGQPKRLYVAAKSSPATEERRGHAESQDPRQAGDAGSVSYEARLDAGRARPGTGSGALPARANR
jgi:SAM-dependent methyltransferase